MSADEGVVSIQARMLFVGGNATDRVHAEALQVKNLVSKLKQDFRYNWKMIRGYAVFTTFTSNEDLTAHII